MVTVGAVRRGVVNVVGDARCAVVVVVGRGKKSGGSGCQENKAQGGRMFQTVRV